MRPEDFTSSTTGRLINIGPNRWAFVPTPLPPILNQPHQPAKLEQNGEPACTNSTNPKSVQKSIRCQRKLFFYRAQRVFLNPILTAGLTADLTAAG